MLNSLSQIFFKSARLVLTAIFGLFLTTSCAKQGVSPRSTINVLVSIPPEAYLVKRIGGDDVSVEILIQPGDSPVNFEPTPSGLAKISKMDLYFPIGAPFEAGWMDRITAVAPRLEIIDVSQDLPSRFYGDEGAGAGRRDPHVWTTPANLSAISELIADALIEQRPDQADGFIARRNALTEELSSLDTEIRDILMPVTSCSFVTYHASWGYFADEFGCRQIAIQTSGVETGPRQMTEILEDVRASGAMVVFVQPQFTTAGAEMVAGELGLEVVLADPLSENIPESIRHFAIEIARHAQ